MKANGKADVLIVGAGIVGAACAYECAQAGLSTAVFDPGPVGGGATAASMGHLVALDGSAEEFALSHASLVLWKQWLEDKPDRAKITEYAPCGTLWLASDDEELQLAQQKANWFTARGWAAEMLSASDLVSLEPCLRPGLAGALRVKGDALLYPPKAAALLLSQSGAKHIHQRVVQVDTGHIKLADGSAWSGAAVVLAAGLACRQLVPHLSG